MVNNSTSFGSDTVNGTRAAMYYTVINPDGTQTLYPNGYYPAGILTITVSQD